MVIVGQHLWDMGLGLSLAYLLLWLLLYFVEMAQEVSSNEEEYLPVKHINAVLDNDAEVGCVVGTGALNVLCNRIWENDGPDKSKCT